MLILSDVGLFCYCVHFCFFRLSLFRISLGRRDSGRVKPYQAQLRNSEYFTILVIS